VVICKGREIVIGALAARWGGKPLVLRRTGSPPSPNSKKIIWRTKKLVDGVITNTETIRKVYLDKGFTAPDFVKVIYNGMEFRDHLNSYDFKHEFPGKKMVLCIGRAVGHKGYFYLIDALQEIKNSHPDAMLYIIGDGKDRLRLNAYAKSKGVDDMIHFAGYIHEPVPYILGCDLFLHPSLYEGMPNAPMEAMAYGKPVIMTRVNGADELSKNGELAVLIPPADSSAIANAVNNALNDIPALQDMASGAKKHVRENYSIAKMTDNLDKYIRQRLKLKKLTFPNKSV
jgi:glycosyltransferase involved in cell wall biosynthesis